MKERITGLIIHLPGILGRAHMAGAMAYAASKYGLNGMMKSLCEELKRTQLSISQLFVGGFDTHLPDNIDLKMQREKLLTAVEVARTIKVASELVIQPMNHPVI